MYKTMDSGSSKYMVTRINMQGVNTLADYKKAVFSATTVFCDNLQDVWEFCGGKLHRERHGYSGINGNFEYCAERIRK